MGPNLLPRRPNTESLNFNLGGPAAGANSDPMVSVPGVDLNFGAQGSSAVPINQMSMAGSMNTGTGLSTDNVSGLMPPAPGTGATGWAETPWASKAQTIMGGIGQLGKLYAAFQANKLGRDSLDFQKKSFRENMNNQKTSFNMSLEDRANSRAGFAGNTPQATRAADEYIARHRLEK